MGAEYDRLVASIAALSTQVSALEDFVEGLPTTVVGATPAQLTAFADSVDAETAKVAAVITV